MDDIYIFTFLVGYILQLIMIFAISSISNFEGKYFQLDYNFEKRRFCFLYYVSIFKKILVWFITKEKAEFGEKGELDFRQKFLVVIGI